MNTKNRTSFFYFKFKILLNKLYKFKYTQKKFNSKSNNINYFPSLSFKLEATLARKSSVVSHLSLGTLKIKLKKLT